MAKPQRQDSLADQLRDLIPIAEQEGLYDAADHIRSFVLPIERRANKIYEHRYGGGKDDK
jgi:hypothetical protein